ncbi:hypothetical protein GC173_16920 [bacterium]|nr:hypothetical protein [bacterium]
MDQADRGNDFRAGACPGFALADDNRHVIDDRHLVNDRHLDVEQYIDKNVENVGLDDNARPVDANSGLAVRLRPQRETRAQAGA